MSYFHLGREMDDPEYLRIDRWKIANKLGRYKPMQKINDEYVIDGQAK